jgi:polyisoprenoid-binding protein YceI
LRSPRQAKKSKLISFPNKWACRLRAVLARQLQVLILTNAAASKAEVEIELASIDTGSDEANTEVKREGWFNVQKFPTAKFVSTAVKDVGSGRFEATGKLTIKGKSRDIMAPFLLKAGANGASIAEGKFVIKRSQFGIGEGLWADPDTVADEVEVKFKVPLTAAPNKK